MSDDFFDELLTLVRRLTGLTTRDAAQVAFEFDPEDGFPQPQAIIEKANDLGFDVEVKHAANEDESAPLGAEIEMDPASVLTAVYMTCPRVMMTETPRMGRAPKTLDIPDELRDAIDSLPEQIKAAIVDVNLLDGQMTVWLYDEANEIDRAIGPIDMRRYDDMSAINEAMMDLMRRINRVLAADTN